MDRIIDFDLAAQAPTGRIRAWKQMLDENLMRVECSDAGEDMQAVLKVRALDGGSINRTRFTRQTLYRTPALVRQAPEETALLVFVQDGTHVIQQGRQSATLEGRGIYLLDSSRPFEVNFASDEIRQGALHVPKAAIAERIGVVEDLAFGPGTPLQQLLSTFACGVIDSLEAHDAETLDALLTQILDLFALMAARGDDRSIAPSTHRAGMLLRIKTYVGAHLHDESLTLERAARALGISSRYVNALLATEDTSFGRYLAAMRLEGARREIMNPRHLHKQVTEVALAWGFKNASHFSRTFKDKFGMTPRDAKWRKPKLETP